MNVALFSREGSNLKLPGDLPLDILLPFLQDFLKGKYFRLLVITHEKR